jgi:hypothetical protein
LHFALGLLLLVVPSAAFAQNDQPAKPAVVISLTSVDDLLGDLGYLTRAAGSPEVGQLITFSAAGFIQGLDTTKPAGAFLYVTDAGRPTPVVFIPVSDFDVVASNIEDRIGALKDVGGGIQQLDTPQAKVFLKEQDGWVFASQAEAHLKDLPEDPTARLNGLHEDYDIAFQVNVQSIPPDLRKTALAEIKEGFESNLDAGGNGEQRALQQQFGGFAIDDIVRFVEESEQLTLGWGVDRKAGKTYIDFKITAVPGTQLADELAAYVDVKSDFSGFVIPNAAATLHFTAPVPARDIEQTKLMLKVAREAALREIDDDDDLPNDKARTEAKEIIESLLDIVQATVESGKLNAAAALVLAPEKINFIAGGKVADGKVVEKNLKRIVELAKQTKDTPDIDFHANVEQYEDIAFHTLSVPVPDEEEARRILGERMKLMIGTGKQSVYVAFGTGSLDLLKEAIRSSREGGGDELPPFSLNVALTPIMAFAASVENDEVVAALAESLKNGNGKDRISVTGTTIKGGVAYRFEVGEGILQTIGQATKLQGARDREPF